MKTTHLRRVISRQPLVGSLEESESILKIPSRATTYNKMGEFFDPGTPSPLKEYKQKNVMNLKRQIKDCKLVWSVSMKRLNLNFLPASVARRNSCGDSVVRKNAIRAYALEN